MACVYGKGRKRLSTRRSINRRESFKEPVDLNPWGASRTETWKRKRERERQSYPWPCLEASISFLGAVEIYLRARARASWNPWLVLPRVNRNPWESIVSDTKLRTFRLDGWSKETRNGRIVRGTAAVVRETTTRSSVSRSSVFAFFSSFGG